ncbi:MAG: type I secretion system permease/ATPase, partial [Hyphomicrobiaceae bacterium]
SDRVLTSSSVETLIMLTTVVVGALAVFALLDVVRRYILMRVAVRLETTLGGPVLSAAAKSAQSGSTRDFQTLQDLQQVRSFITGPVILAMFDAPVAPVYFLAVYLIHPHLGIIVTVAALILLVIAVVNQKITAVPFSRANAFAMRAGFQAEAMARNAQIVNAMGMIQEGVMHWGRETAEALKAQVIAQDRNVQLTGISKFLRLATQVSMLGWGAYLAIDGQLTGGMMIAASIVGSRALAPIEGLIEGWRGYVQARGGYARIKALLGNSPLNLERLTLPRPQGRLKVERVLYVPPPTKRVILNGIDFSLDPGESMAVVGPSGTGKSTLARMLVGSIAPTSGSVRLDLMDIRNWDPRQFGETVGYLPQDVQLFPGSIKANIARLREDVSDEAIFDAAELAGVHAMISQLPQGYETQISIDGTPLSGGQRQRLGLARAFFGEPRLVVLDEPNSNLDSAGERALGAALQRAKVKGITVIAVTQRPALMRSVDKIMLLNEGRIQKLGPRDEILPLLSNRNRKSITDAA